LKNINTFEFHKNNPRGTVEEYIKSKRVELSHDINKSKKIYLDLKYWILLRDARIRKDVDENVLKLLQLIENLVSRECVICPISYDIFSELLKQSDIESLKSTAKLIDDLSKGVSILNPFERLDLEVFHFVSSKLNTDSVYFLNELVWTKTAYIMGFYTPHSKAYPLDIDNAIQKAFIDQMWVISMSDFLYQIGFDNLPKISKFSDISERLNENKLSHIDDNASFKQMFLEELAGLLDWYKPDFKNLMIYLYESKTGQKVIKEEASSDNAGQWFANLIYHAFRLNKITSELPSFHIMAKLHAATRWDKNRIIKPNDIYDINHAVEAIPFYDYFLTEHSLRHLVNNKNLGFESIFRCKTISDIDDAISELSQISSNK
jgi:hypothetical protein